MRRIGKVSEDEGCNDCKVVSSGIPVIDILRCMHHVYKNSIEDTTEELTLKEIFKERVNVSHLSLEEVRN